MEVDMDPFSLSEISYAGYKAAMCLDRDDVSRRAQECRDKGCPSYIRCLLLPTGKGYGHPMCYQSIEHAQKKQ